MIPIDLIICADYLLTMDEGDGLIRDGAVAVQGEKIIEVGQKDALLGKYSARRVLQGKGRAVIPGLINTHTHAAMVFMRGMADDLPLKEWLEGHIWPVENKWLGPDFMTDAVRLACLEMLKAGVTTFNDMYFFEDVAASVAKDFGMRAVLGAGIIDFPTKTTTGADDCLQKAERFIKEWKGDAFITPAVAPHAAYTCGPDTLMKSCALAAKYDVLCHTHLSETEWEVEEVKKKYGKAPARHLADIGFLDGRVVAAHCVWLTDEEIDLLAAKKVSVSHCVESNLKLASGIARVPEMLKAGIRVAFGTDGAASNNDLNILSEMSTAAKLHKAVSKDPTALDAKTVLLMATKWGAEALGIDNVGSLRPGMAADMAVINLNKPHLSPVYNVYSHLVYSAMASDVEAVIVNGKLIVEGGRLLTADEEEILHKAKKWGERIRAER